MVPQNLASQRTLSGTLKKQVDGKCVQRSAPWAGQAATCVDGETGDESNAYVQLACTRPCVDLLEAG